MEEKRKLGWESVTGSTEAAAVKRGYRPLLGGFHMPSQGAAWGCGPPGAGSAGLSTRTLVTCICAGCTLHAWWHFPVVRDFKEQQRSYLGSFNNRSFPYFLCAKNPAQKPPLISSIRCGGREDASPTLLQDNLLWADLLPRLAAFSCCTHEPRGPASPGLLSRQR